MERMSDAERRAFLAEGAPTAQLATVRADGRPHVAPIWFRPDGDDLVFTTWHDSVKGRNLTRDPQAAVSVDDPRFPFAFVVLEVTLVLRAIPPLLVALSDVLGAVPVLGSVFDAAASFVIEYSGIGGND